MDQENPDNQSGQKVVRKTSFQVNEHTAIRYDLETLTTPQLERRKISTRPSINRPKMHRNIEVYRTDNPNLKHKLQKLPRNKSSIKDKFVETVPDYISLWPRSEILACYFQFVALLASVLAVEYTTFNFVDGLSSGVNKISLAGDKLTRVESCTTHNSTQLFTCV